MPGPIRNRGSHIEKSWPLVDLLSPAKTIQCRVQIIETLGRTLGSFPESEFRQTGGQLILRQRRVKKGSLPIKRSTLREPLLELAADLDQGDGMGFIHGDICYKNTIWDGGRLWIVDLEPDLIQRRSGIRQLMVTPPWVAHCDLKRGEVTAVSDRIAFTALCMRMLHGMPKRLDYRKIYVERKEKDIPLPWGIRDELVIGRTFIDLASESLESESAEMPLHSRRGQ
jgi:hypothetical protein